MSSSGSQSVVTRIGSALLGLCLFVLPLEAQDLPSIADHTAGMEAMEGFLDLYWDEGEGKLFMQFDDMETGFIYQVSMGSGLGSNPINIDRGQLRGTWLMEPMRVGPKVLLIEPNYRFQARSDNPQEVAAVRDAFAPSTHWGFDIVAQTGEAVLVDATDFFLRDARNVIGQIQQSGQGTFQQDMSRSVMYMDRTASFPDNTEVEAMLTFTSDRPGNLVRAVAASGNAITLRQHHSLVRLPDDGYTPRIADPRVGVNGPTIHDYATPINEDLRVRWVARHRLEKQDPSAEMSPPVEPIIYYLDPGVPEPIASALIEGAAWWNQAYEAAGFIDAFRVEVLPDGVDPMDVRYNMIHWTHRRTRGYSYGGSVTDPRTGEILKGNVNLGSLRLRQDYLHGQGMIPAFSMGEGSYYDEDGTYWEACGLSAAPGFEYLAQVAGDASSVEMALARVRQLSAHEVGHTLGFPHNYMSSTYDRESVMDYPAPLAEIVNGEISLDNAYVPRIGEYDKLTVKWLYADFPDGTDETQALLDITREGMDDGWLYMGHTNNNFRGAGHEFAGVWDNGADLVDHLKVELDVRRIGLENFGPEVIREGEPMSNLEQVLLPLYMHHRFQMNSAVQHLGGANYTYAMRGDGQTPVTVIPRAEQLDALETVLSTLTPEFLALPPHIVEMIPPPAYRYGQGESFDGYTELLFDPLGAAEGAADLTATMLFHPQRMARLVVYGSMGDYPDLEEVVDRILEVTWGAPTPSDEYHQQVQHVIQRVVADKMMVQGSQAENMAEVRAVLTDRLGGLADAIEAQGDGASPHAKMVASDIRRWQDREDATIPGPKLEIPPGDPIGGSSR